MKDIVSRAYRRLPHADANSFGTTLYLNMSVNALFTSLKPMIDALKVANDDLSAAIADAKVGGRATTIAKKESFDVVIDKMDELAIEVNRIAKGDEKIVLTSGFEVRTTASRSYFSDQSPTRQAAADIKITLPKTSV